MVKLTIDGNNIRVDWANASGTPISIDAWLGKGREDFSTEQIITVFSNVCANCPPSAPMTQI